MWRYGARLLKPGLTNLQKQTKKLPKLISNHHIFHFTFSHFISSSVCYMHAVVLMSEEKIKFNHHIGWCGRASPTTKYSLQFPWVDNWLMANIPLCGIARVGVTQGGNSWCHSSILQPRSSCPQVGWTRVSGRVTILPDFGSVWYSIQSRQSSVLSVSSRPVP